MAIGDLFRVTVKQNIANNPVTFTLGYEQTGQTGTPEGQLASMLAAAVAGPVTDLKNGLGSDYTIESVTARKITGQPEPLSLTQIGEAKGTSSIESIPAFKVVLVTHIQQDADVRSNGKTFVSGVPENNIEEDDVTFAPLLANIQLVFDNLLSLSANITQGTADWVMVVLGKPPNQFNPPPAYRVTSNRLRSKLFNNIRRQTKQLGLSDPPQP